MGKLTWLDHAGFLTTHIQGWFYLLFIYLFFSAVMAFKTRVVKQIKLVSFPMVLLVLNVFLYLDLPNTDPSIAIPAAIVALVIAMIIGFLRYQFFMIECDRNQHLVKLPASFMPFFVMLVIIGCEFYFSYQSAIRPGLVSSMRFQLTMLIIFSLCSGFFLGRLFSLFFKFKTSPNVELSIYSN